MTTRANQETIDQQTISQHINHNKRPRLDLSPVVYINAKRIQNALPTRALTVLLDSGSSHTLIKDSSLPYGTTPDKSSPKRTTTTNGVFATTARVVLTDVKFPEFGNHRIDVIEADVFHSPTCRYDVILGRDILRIMGAKLDFHTQTIVWLDRQIPMKRSSKISTPSQEEYLLEEEEEEDYSILFEVYADDVIIKDGKYQAVSPDEVVNQLTHLTVEQKRLLHDVFEKYKMVFDGTLGKHPTAKIDIELVPGSKPIYQNPNPVPFR